ncbi:MAG: fluoride efflux transporter CrcB [Pseudomonadota bacterium]
MTDILFIALGGALGAAGRYGVTGFFTRLLGPDFPYGTLAVNVLGSFVLGLVIGIGAHYIVLSEQFKMFFITGFLGAFTTFSTFSLNTVTLFERGEVLQASAYIAASVIVSIAMLMLGLMMTRIGGSV